MTDGKANSGYSQAIVLNWEILLGLCSNLERCSKFTHLLVIFLLSFYRF